MEDRKQKLEEFTTFVNKYWHLTKLTPSLPIVKNEGEIKSDLDNSLSLEKLHELKRGRWYCNLTGEIIPQLQSINFYRPERDDKNSRNNEKEMSDKTNDNENRINDSKNRISDDKNRISDSKDEKEMSSESKDTKEKDEDENKYYKDEDEEANYKDENERERKISISEQLYLEGYNTYHAYLCGHCFIDVYLISAVFDWIHSYLSTAQELRRKGEAAIDDYATKTLTKIFAGVNNPSVTKINGSTSCSSNSSHHSHSHSLCPLCPLCFYGEDTKCNRLAMYSLYTEFNLGTIILRKKIIPRQHLCVIAHELKIGDIVDTSGYRGTGLYIYEGDGKFLEVPREEYYPIWPLKYLKLRGYTYYLTNEYEKTNDGIEFENNLLLVSDGDGEIKFVDSESKNKIDGDGKDKIDGDGKDKVNGDGKDKINGDGKNIKDVVITYPFINADQANFIFHSGKNFKARITESENLIFENRKIFIAHDNGARINLIDAMY